MRVLVVEDDRHVARQLESVLTKAGYVVDVAHDGEEGHFLGENEAYDAVVLDLGLPGVEGLTVVQRWRHNDRRMPILILTARDTWREKVAGLRAGADDYLAKPFAVEEVLARVEALIRRTAGHASPLLSCGPVELDISSQRVIYERNDIDLTALEFRALSYLMHHQGKVVSKTELTEHIYGQDFDRDSNVIEVLISRLRHKLDASLIRTHRGQGYRLAPPDDVS